MFRPSQEVFEELATRGSRVPVVREMLADMDTPLSLFRRLDDGRTSFLLESVEGEEHWARYSFIGCGSRAIFRATGSDVEWVSGGDEANVERLHAEGDPLEILRERLSALRVPPLEEPGLPPFLGGAVGMVAYDWVRFVERIPDGNPDVTGLPDLWFSFPETVVAYDNVRKSALLIRHVDVGPGIDAAAAYREVTAELDALVRKLREPLPREPERVPVTAPMDVQRSVSREEFHEAVKRAKDYIEAGDAFQIVLSQQFRIPLQVDPFTIYRQLRLVNPSPYLFFVRCGGPVLIGSSPESQVRLQDGQIDLRPIAGTRRRGDTPEEDLEIETGLLADPKERAEHLMLVDLGRNDLGRGCETGSDGVPELMAIEEYATVFQLVSTVTGRLREGCDALDLVRAAFPPGSMTGAPKIAAIRLLDRLEPVRRGLYAGAIGYLDARGAADLSVVIRTLFAQRGRALVHAGGGIVADSDPHAEWRESLDKAEPLLAALEDQAGSRTREKKSPNPVVRAGEAS